MRHTIDYRPPNERKRRRPWAPGQGPARTTETSVFPGGQVRELWKLDPLPRGSPPTGALGPPSCAASPPLGVVPQSTPPQAPAVHPTGQPGTCRPDQGRHPERAQRVEGPHAPVSKITQVKEIVATHPGLLPPVDSRPMNHMIENSSLTVPDEISAQLPPPVTIELPERESQQTHLPRRRKRPPRAKVQQPDAALQVTAGEDISLTHHAARCSICNHPDRDEIEQGFLHWESPTRLAHEFNLGHRRAVYRHARALGLFKRRVAHSRRILEFIMEKAESVTPTADSIIRAVRAYACLSEDGRWTEPTKRVIITHEYVEPATISIPPARTQGERNEASRGEAPSQPAFATSHPPQTTDEVAPTGMPKLDALTLAKQGFSHLKSAAGRLLPAARRKPTGHAPLRSPDPPKLDEAPPAIGPPQTAPPLTLMDTRVEQKSA